MSFRHPNDEMIERYLLHQLNAEERNQFEFQMMMNPKLRQRVKDYRLLMKSIQTTTPTKPSGFFRIDKSWLFISGIVLVGGVLYFSIFHNTKEKYSKGIPQTEIINPDTTPSDRGKTNEPKPKLLEEKKDNTPKNIKEPNPPQASKKVISTDKNLIAFQPNPLIEDYYQSNFRGPISINLIAPKPKQTITLDQNEGSFKLQGIISGLTDSVAIRALIFNNRKKDFEDFKPQFTFSINSTFQNDTISFEQEINLKAESGLYYLLLEDTITEEWLLIEKILLK